MSNSRASTSKRSPFFRTEPKPGSAKPLSDLSAFNLNRSISDQALAKLLWDVVMVTLKRSTLYLISIGELDEFFH
jgi:hypothetical protein